MSSETDQQGRLYIPEEIRQKYGEKYHLVQYEDRIELIPVADVSLAAVRKAADELREASIGDIQADIEAEAKADARDTDATR